MSTGLAAQLLQTTEPRLAELVRRGKIDPAPLVVSGRRRWLASHLLQAAHQLGVLTGDLRQRLTVADHDRSTRRDRL
jgi:hypothetical protein